MTDKETTPDVPADEPTLPEEEFETPAVETPAEPELLPDAVRDADGKLLREWDSKPIGAIKNRTVFTGDNLDVLRRLNSDTVDLIYLDPPFNSNRQYAAPVGSKAAGAAFDDTWNLSKVDLAWHQQLDEEHPKLHEMILAARAARGDSTMSYLLMMAPRLIEMKRVLKDTGSIYLHCDPTESHSLKLLMDVIFGKNNFRNEIIWSYKKWANSGQLFQKNHDVILFYSGGDRHTFNKQYGPLSDQQVAIQKRGYNAGSKDGQKIVRVYDPDAPGVKARMEKWKAEGRSIYFVGERKGNPIGSVWDIPMLGGGSKERTGFKTQKPLKLLERIIEASSNKGDVVLDPFCGCATAPVAAELLQRRWIGIDLERKSIELCEDRFREELGMPGTLAVHWNTYVEGLPNRTDQEKLPKPATHRKDLFVKQDGKCAGCRNDVDLRQTHIDHRVAKSKGGTDHISNLQILCGNCNTVKGNRPMSYLTAQLLLRKGLDYDGQLEEIVRERRKYALPTPPDEAHAALDEAWAKADGDAKKPGSLKKERLAKAMEAFADALLGDDD